LKEDKKAINQAVYRVGRDPQLYCRRYAARGHAAGRLYKNIPSDILPFQLSSTYCRDRPTD
jgi:hypothetical protein